MEPKLELKDLLAILFERSNATTTLWNMEIAVVLGLVAFLGTGAEMAGHWVTKVALAVGFGVMASLNGKALVKVSEQRQELVDFIRKHETPVFANSSKWRIDPLSVPPVWRVISLHGIIDLMVLMVIWFYPASRP